MFYAFSYQIPSCQILLKIDETHVKHTLKETNQFTTSKSSTSHINRCTLSITEITLATTITLNYRHDKRLVCLWLGQVRTLSLCGGFAGVGGGASLTNINHSHLQTACDSTQIFQYFKFTLAGQLRMELCFHTKYQIMSWTRSKQFVELFSVYHNNFGIFILNNYLGLHKITQHCP